jgi:hypothetical protein
MAAVSRCHIIPTVGKGWGRKWELVAAQSRTGTGG